MDIILDMFNETMETRIIKMDEMKTEKYKKDIIALEVMSISQIFDMIQDVQKR